MVIKTTTNLFEVLDQFDPINPLQLKALESLVRDYPYFHLVQPYLLKAIQQQKHEEFDTPQPKGVGILASLRDAL